MRRAVALAARGAGETSPNPVVGCVILNAAGEPVGEGYHQRAGGPHAEIHALRAAGEHARGGTALVTLEPCDHTGRTGPCSRALIDAGIARVRYAVADPHAAAAGGAATLAAAGVDVAGGLLAAEAAEVNRAWLTSVRHGRPFVRWKFAATLDGRTAAADGSSRWITSPAARADVHRLRAAADAVVVGSGTARADDPHLAARLPDPAASGSAVRQPLRVVLDTGATAVKPGARVLDGAAPTLIAVAEDAGTAHLAGRTGDGTVSVVRLPRAPGGQGLSVPALLEALYARDVRSVLLEGGARLAGSFVAAGAVDEVTAYLAPALLGAGPAALAGGGIGTIAEALRLEVTAVDRIGPDLRITAAVPGPPPAIRTPSVTAPDAPEEN
ncbi:bifunctional diaminohydroxyphosphoribosylaminopyrimidine deaminase/5-amino-6-(5-phosphoribosylamino)uracil reductase RibD [Streptomyces zingiberis]|uniref:Riboflavin biosynthesis protein RibD n=1 Tax=Streptomyces zingiberis TaxID=2053010 RepID=A0ABX1C2T3_9ACTN|nr:bifunctional diaminohydroxyphosphoribosylaminopyrimidine deaminase/5-amino-6-(5-phosphoribosylamino)uracil reductase RibD [Streptomyces zingiberis]NJQ03101.1 bifunctional diaminohydroxyphosphoribosylaminopyrimidine deaminase/5-amino-6-(5-phosphoribosylamino)uracil reductase RibD [Streptomyces zingiberis]